MRRNRQALLRTYYLKYPTTSKNIEGGTVRSYGAPVAIQAVIRHTSGRMVCEAWGERAPYMLTLQYDGPAVIQEGDGICVYVGQDEDPDYIVRVVKGLTEDAFRVYEIDRAGIGGA